MSRAVKKYNINKTFVVMDHESGDYPDSKLSGFYLRVSSQGKCVYIAKAKKKGTRQTVTVTIGKHGDKVTAEFARQKASEYLLMLRQGQDPNEERRRLQEKDASERVAREVDKLKEQITLQSVLADYFKSKNLKESTRYNYRCVVNAYLGDWLNKPMLAVSKDMVETRHKQVTDKHGKGAANNTMRVLRALFIYAGYEYEIEGEPIIKNNPVTRLSQVKAWHKLARRQTVIKAHQLKSWYSAVSSLGNTSVRDYLLFMLFTGMRKNEAARLKWTDVDLHAKTILIRDTKNGEPYMVPMSDYLHNMLLKRWQRRENHYVFDGKSCDGYIGDARYHYDDVTERCGVKFMPHDLRRTFVTVAESLEISERTIKRLINHKDENVTSGYVVSEAERLRNAMQRVTDQIKHLAGIKIIRNRRPNQKLVAVPA